MNAASAITGAVAIFLYGLLLGWNMAKQQIFRDRLEKTLQQLSTRAESPGL